MNEDIYEEANPDENQEIPLRSGALAESFILQPVKTVMHTKVGTVFEDYSVKAAVDQMVAGNYGCVVIVQAQRPVGIFTERDVMSRIVARDLNPNRELVGDHMTRNPEYLQPDDQVAYALNMMILGNYRHVPVVDERHHLVGIFSIRDLQREVVGHFEKEILTLPPSPIHWGPHRRFAG